MKDHPQLLEKLGIKVYSEGYVRAKPKTNGEQPPAVQTAPDNNKKKKRK
ncbi:MAG: hypothetical protein NT166_00695 [Candidatus Aminicenantes bacterium]|nr:hypothetical protein [Candidatus Aminicenantes bacterium]